MPPKKDTNAGGAESDAQVLTPVEMKLLCDALKYLPASARASINFGELADKHNYKDAKSCRTRFWTLCKKFEWFENEASGEKTPRSTPKKRVAGPEADAASPTSKKPRGKKAKEEKDGEDEKNGEAEKDGEAQKEEADDDVA